MYDFLEFIILVLALSFLSGPVLGTVALLRANKARRELAELRGTLSPGQAPGQTPAAAAPEKETKSTFDDPWAPGPKTAPEAIEDEAWDAAPPTARPEPDTPPDPDPAAEPESDAKPAPLSQPEPDSQSAPAPKPESAKEGFEQKLAARWLVWLGGIALALGAAFLVKVTFDSGLITPAIRCTLGVLLGLGLAVGGEVLRRRPRQLALATRGFHALPQAITAAGIASLFAGLYAAHGLYDLIGATTATLALALTAYLAVGLSLLQGRFVALLGVIGGFITPLVVASDTPAALPHFIYLTALVVPALAIARWRVWPSLAGLALGGSVLWALLWMAAAWQGGDALVVGLFLLVLTLAAVAWRYGLLALFTRAPDGPGQEAPDWLVGGAMAAIAVALFGLLRMDHYGTLSVATLLLFAAFSLYNGRRASALEPLALIAGLLGLAALASWHLPQFVPGPEPLVVMAGTPIGEMRSPILPPALVPFATAGGLLAALFWAAGHLFLRGANRPGLWASLGTAMPLAILVTAYWRVAGFEVSLPWAGLALLLAFVSLFAARRLVEQRASRDEAAGAPPLNAALAVYALGAIAAVTLAMTMQLREAWLTVALAAQLPAIAWVNQRLPLRGLRIGALVLAGAVLLRLILNQTLLAGTPVGAPLVNWLLYGYGLPAICFWLASRGFRHEKDDLLVAVLEGGALFFTVLLVSFEIRSFFNAGDLTAGSYSFVEQATQGLSWAGLATACLFLHGRHPRPVLLWGSRLLGLVTIGHGLLGPLGLSNPLLKGVEVGDWPVFNLMGLAYLLPAMIAALHMALARRQGEIWMARLAGLAVLGLVFVDITLEVRHAFHGTRLDLGPTPDAEWYAYSLAWLVYGAGLLAAGLAFHQKALRYASLAVIFLVVGKVFLFDMAALTGFYRALSFIGLGGCLLGIGYLYQRFVFAGQAEPEGPDPATDRQSAS